MSKLWVAWEDDTSIRSRVLADELGAEFLAYVRFTDGGVLKWLRYPTAAVQTAWALVSRRPSLLVVQNPSILLAFLAALLKPLIRYTLLIDLHTPLAPPSGLSGTLVQVLHDYGLRHCSGVIVTNEAYRQTVSLTTSRPIFVLPDKVPDLEAASRRLQLHGERNVLYICTYSEDEPWSEVLAAAPLVRQGTCIYISGRSPLKKEEVPRNVRLTGYLPRREYEELLHSVDAVMVLTTADNNLVCGGYEAVAAGKPLILSDTTALRELFGRGAVFTRNDRDAIAAAIDNTFSRLRNLNEDMDALKSTMSLSWAENWRTLLDGISALQRASA